MEIKSSNKNRAILWFPKPLENVKNNEDTSADEKVKEWIDKGRVRLYDRHHPLFRVSRDSTRIVCVRAAGDIDVIAVMAAYGKNSDKDEKEFTENMGGYKSDGGDFINRALDRGVSNYLKEYEEDEKFMVEYS